MHMAGKRTLAEIKVERDRDVIASLQLLKSGLFRI